MEQFCNEKKIAKSAKSFLLELQVYTSGLTSQRLVYFAISDSRISIDSNFAIFIVLTLTSDILRNVLLPVGHYGNTSLNSDVEKSFVGSSRLIQFSLKRDCAPEIKAQNPKNHKIIRATPPRDFFKFQNKNCQINIS